MKWMHDKQDRNKLKLFRYMRTRGEAPVLQVMEDLDMSRYIVLSTTQQLAIDIEMITGMTDGILIEGGSDVRFSVPATVRTTLSYDVDSRPNGARIIS